MPAPRLDDLPAGLLNLADHEAHAHQVLDPATWAYFSGAAADGITQRANRSAWDGLRLTPRVLRPLGGGHTRIQLLGHTLPHPVLLAPVAAQRLAHPDGETASAAAASALGAGMVLSTQSGTPLEVVAQAFGPGAPGRGPLWFQLYWQHDRGFNRALVQRAESLGFQALVLTVDAPVHGLREAERRAGFSVPAGHASALLQGLPPAPEAPPSQHPVFDHWLARAPTWDDVAWLQGQTRLPVLLKGILHPEDARQALGLNIGGLIVSNHGGRTLDTAVATAHALPRIADAVQGQVPLLVDGGIRRGTDILKAMALGASAVMVGRPIVHALACGGARGVAHMLRLLRDELEIAMALTGCRTLADASPALLSN